MMLGSLFFLTAIVWSIACFIVNTIYVVQNEQKSSSVVVIHKGVIYILNTVSLLLWVTYMFLIVMPRVIDKPPYSPSKYILFCVLVVIICGTVSIDKILAIAYAAASEESSSSENLQHITTSTSMSSLGISVITSGSIIALFCVSFLVYIITIPKAAGAHTKQRNTSMLSTNNLTDEDKNKIRKLKQYITSTHSDDNILMLYSNRIR